MTAAQKQYVQEKFEETGNEPNEEEGSENQKASLLFDDFGDNAQFLRDVHGRLTEKLDQFYEQFKISKTKEEVSREAEKAIRKALSAAQKEIKKQQQAFAATQGPRDAGVGGNFAPSIPDMQIQIPIYIGLETTAVTNIGISSLSLEGNYDLILDNHFGIKFWFEDMPTLTFYAGLNSEWNLTERTIDNPAVGLSVQSQEIDFLGGKAQMEAGLEVREGGETYGGINFIIKRKNPGKRLEKQ